MATAAATATTDPNALAESYLPLVDHVVNQLASRFPRHVDRDELRGAGAAGLVDAAHRYDPATGVPFPRYAAIRIRGAIIDVTRTRDWATRRLRRDLRSIDQAADHLEETLQRRPDDDEIANHLGIDVELIRERRASALTSSLLTLDRPTVGLDGEASPLADRIVEHDLAWRPDAALENAELVGTLRAAIEHLPELPKRVLTEHHFQGRLLRHIADDLGVTEARVSQLRQEALHALQAFFSTSFDEVPKVPDDAPGRRQRAAFVSQLATATTWRSRLDAAGAGDDRFDEPAEVPA